ncbi:MAG TPA: transglycosylase SLT domain-containing protein [Tabrizicola sp.]|nr:transglycosylase SLT domain-containing protein [Tabrizicola sp.]
MGRFLGFASLLLMLLVACGDEPGGVGGAASSGAEDSDAAPLAWEANHPERQAWSQRLRAEIALQLGDFGVPSDIASYCPGYGSLPDPQRGEVWATLAVAIARRESSYKPTTVFMEPPPLNVASVGLFQLSYEDGFGWCSLDLASESLKDPLNNIDCAVGAMARYVKRDGVVAAGSSSGDARGLARYWSVIRDGSTHFKAEIMAATRALPFCEG